MKSERAKFCGETIEALERKVKELQGLVANRGSAPDDRDISKAILNLINARAILLAEAAAYELEDGA